MKTLDEINGLRADVEGERFKYVQQSRDMVRIWELRHWSAQDEYQADQEGRQLATSQEPRSIVNLASRLIASAPSIYCPSDDITSASEAAARTREKFLTTLWAIQGNAQDIDPISALKFNMLVRGRGALKVLWVRDVLPPNLAKIAPPVRFIPLNPEDIGIAYGDLYPKFAYHRIAQKARVIEQQFPDANLLKKNGKNYKPNELIDVVDVWWMEDDGTVWQAVTLDTSEFLVQPRETKYTKLPIIERKNDPVPIKGEERSANSILAPIADQWRVRNMLLSMHLTAVGSHLWPAINVTNENGEEVDPIETGMGSFNQLPAGTKVLNIDNRPDIALLQSLEADINNQFVQSTFASELYGKAPDSRQAGYGLGMLMEAAQGRIKETVAQMEMLISEANELALCAVEHFAGSKGAQIYGYNQRNNSVYSAVLFPEEVNGMYFNSVTLAERLPSDKLQMGALALQFNQAKVLSRRTVRDQYLPFDVPDDEELQVMAEQIVNDPDLLAAIVREAAMLKGIQLPGNEPDWEKTPKQQPQQQQPQGMPQQQVGVQQPQMPIPQMPDAQGALTPESMGQPGMSPEQFAMMMGNPPSSRDILARQLVEGGGMPEDMRPRP